ncbi:MAG: CoA pyrophosphatase [Bacteroidota bacterium]
MEIFPQFIPKLKQRLQEPLPGLDVQMRMVPGDRDRGDKINIPENARKAAVMLLLYPHENKFHIPFIQRAEDGRVHGGQISFPGGSHDKTDPDFEFTALREVEEEIGVQREKIEVLGPISPIYIPPSNFIVETFVGVIEKRPVFTPDPVEVARVVEIEVEEFRKPENIGIHRVDVFAGNFIDAPGYTPYGSNLIWGGTSMIIAEFMEIVEQVKSLSR